MYSSRIYLAALLTLLATVPIKPATAETPDCIRGSSACSLDKRSYHVLLPDNWDGKTKLPIMLYFHGWGRQGHIPVNHAEIGKVTRKSGVLLIAPNGLGKSWDFWQPDSRDTQFAKAVLDELEQTLPLDRDRLIVSGYSWGSSMAWRYACEAGDTVWVLLGISGTLYEQTQKCRTGPVEARHVHGLKDTVMDYPFGPDGNETGPVALWLRTNGCKKNPESEFVWNGKQEFRRLNWQSCDSQKPVTLDIHRGGHWIARGWLKRQLDEILKNPGNS